MKQQSLNLRIKGQGPQSATKQKIQLSQIANAHKFATGITTGGGLGSISSVLKTSNNTKTLSSNHHHERHSINNNNENGASMYDNIPAKLNSLANEYKERQKRMDDRLKKEIENHAIASIPVGKKHSEYDTEQQQPLNLRVKTIKNKVGEVSPLQNNDSYINSDNQKTQKFYRSQRSVAMRIKDNYEVQVNSLEQDKLTLIQRLNDSLVQLDKLNQEKAQMSNKLIEMLKFVRDMQRETQKGDDLSAVVNDDLRSEMRSEKELGHQLKEQLKVAEMERVRIMAKLHELSAVTQEGEIVQSDMNVDLTTKVRTFADLQEEYREVLERIRNCEQEVDHLRAVTISNQEHIHLLKDKLDSTVDEKRSLHQKLTVLQDRYDSTLITYQKERHDLDNMQTRHIRLLSTNILFFSLQSILQLNKQSTFDQLRMVSDFNHRNQRGLIRMRGIIKNKRTAMLKNYLNRWFKDGLNPIKSKKQTLMINEKMPLKNPMSFTFYKWQCAYQQILSQKHLKHQIIQSMLVSKDDYNLRAIKHYWTRWRDQVRIDEDAKKKKVIKFLIKKHRSYLRKYFAKWNETSLQLDNQIKLHSMAQRFAFKKYLSMLFSNWRLITTDLKVRRVSLLTRTFKNIQVFAQTQKQLRGQTWMVLREGRKNKENLLKACFDALRHHKEQEKQQRVVSELYEQEIPRKEQAMVMIARVSQDDTQKQREKAVKTLAKCFGKELYKYFNKWRRFTETKDYIINNQFKQRVIKVYLQQLRKAFTSWIEYKGRTMIQFQSEVISNQEDENKDLTNKIVQQTHDNEEKKQRQQCLSSKQIRKILNTAYLKRIREHFNMWHQNLAYKDNQLSNIDKVLTKLNRRQKAQAFKRYLDKIKELRQEQAFEKRVADCRFTLREKLRRRIFNAFKSFSQDHTVAKNYMRRLLARLDVRLKQSAMKKWNRYRQAKAEKILQKQQNAKVENIQQMVLQIGEESDKLENIVQQNKKFKSVLENNGKRIIRLAFQRCLEGSLDYAFQHWKVYLQIHRQKQSLLNKTFKHLFRQSISYAFIMWKKQIANKQHFMIETQIYQESQKIQTLDAALKRSNQNHNLTSDEAQTQITKLQEEQRQLMIRHQKCLKALIGRVDENVVVDKKRYIMEQWKSQVKSRKLGLTKLELAIKKTLWQEGFAQIKAYSIKISEEVQSSNQTQLMINKFWRIKARQCISQWKITIKESVFAQKQQLEKETQLLIRQRNKNISLIQQRIKEQLLEQGQYLSQIDCFTAWKLYIQNEKQLKIKIKTYQSQQEDRDKMRVINKWMRRHEATRKFKHIRGKIDRVYNRALLQEVYQAWLLDNRKTATFCNSLSSLETILSRIYLNRSFKTIKTHSEAKSFSRLRSKLRSAQSMVDCLQLISDKRKTQILNDLRTHQIQSNGMSMRQKAIVKYQITRRIREYFLEWKYESQRRSVVVYMNEEGPLALEKHRLKKMIYNLKLAVIKEGYDKQQVNEIIEVSRRQSLRGIEKSVCRLFCYIQDLYLMPLCLDRWKAWVKQRKLFKYWLNYLNKRLDIRTSDLFQAFQKWKYVDIQRFNELNQLRKPELERYSYKQNCQLQDLENNMIEADQTIQDFTEQRDLLVRRYVGSQRLALAVTTAQCDKTKQKALSQWIDVTAEEIQARYENALKENLKRISDLKNRIKYLEKSNHELSDQNEELRIGALDGIEMAKSIDELSREREKLSVDLADKAITIRKLLEDNNNLSIRLSNAQEEAHNLIRVSQMKLGQSSGNIIPYSYEDY